jgi:toxin ParE1/3/4
MARVRLAPRAEADLTTILATSGERWGPEAERRYAALIAAAFRRIAAHPHGRNTRARDDLMAGLRSFHIRHAREPKSQIKNPVHIVYYQPAAPDLIEVVRVLHESMEPSRHVEEGTEE